jgi:TPR repeat protein
MFKYTLLLSLLFNILNASQLSDEALAQGNFTKAFKLLSKEAKDGDAQAEYNLALMYYQGDGVKRDIEKSAELLESSAQKGYKKAIDNVGRIYMQLLKFDKAKKWLTINAKNGDESAKELLKSIEENELREPL